MTSWTLNYFQVIGFLEFDVVCLGTLHRSLFRYLVQPVLEPPNFLHPWLPWLRSSRALLIILLNVTSLTCTDSWEKLFVNSLHCKNWSLISALRATKHISYINQLVSYLCAFKNIVNYLYSLKFNFSSTSTLNQKYCSHILAHKSFQFQVAYFWTTSSTCQFLTIEFHYISAGHLQLLSVIRLL